MNKLLRERAARWATALLKRKPNAPGARWTYGTSHQQLQAAWLAGARSLDEWHRAKTRKPLKVSDIVTVTMGPLTSGGKALDMNGALLDFTKPRPPLRDDSEFFTIPALKVS